MKKYFVYCLHKIVSAVAKVTANIYSPGARKKIMYEDIVEARKFLQPGDIILTRTDGELTTLLIPGFWKHAALYVNDNFIIDATRAGVTIRYIEDLMMHTDNICVLRLKDITEEQGKQIVEHARSFIGTPYDFEMTIENTNKVYCSELIYNAINLTLGSSKLKTEDTLEVEIYSPEDVYKDGNFYTIFEIKDR